MSGRVVGSTIAALAVVGTVSLALPASAAPLVDPDATGSITVYKYETPETATGLPNNGMPIPNSELSGLTPIEGVEFTVQQVEGIDLTINSGWADAAALADEFNAAAAVDSIADAGYTLASGSSVSTGNSGIVTFANLPLGVYLVQETDAPAGVTPSAPFLVTVPMTDPTNSDAWIYDVHVYPKNTVVGAEKTVDDGDAVQLGDLVTWTITADVPNDEVIDAFRIVDPLDARLDYLATRVSLTNGATLTLDTDYTVAHDVATNTVTVDFTAAGRDVLEANNSARVSVEIDTKVNEVGAIENEAIVYPNLPSITIEPGEPGGPIITPPTETRWGGLTIEKVDEAGSALTGATFQIFTNATDAANQTNPVEVGGVSEFTVVNTDGTLTIDGLRYSDFADGATVAAGDDGYIQYYLVEVEAPAGFELLAKPIEFTVTADTTAVGIDLSVTNIPSNAGFTLPMTGGSGTLLLPIIGGALVIGGVGFALVRRRKSDA